MNQSTQVSIDRWSFYVSARFYTVIYYTLSTCTHKWEKKLSCFVRGRAHGYHYYSGNSSRGRKSRLLWFGREPQNIYSQKLPILQVLRSNNLPQEICIYVYALNQMHYKPIFATVKSKFSIVTEAEKVFCTEGFLPPIPFRNWIFIGQFASLNSCKSTTLAQSPWTDVSSLDIGTWAYV